MIQFSKSWVPQFPADTVSHNPEIIVIPHFTQPQASISCFSQCLPFHCVKSTICTWCFRFGVINRTPQSFYSQSMFIRNIEATNGESYRVFSSSDGIIVREDVSWRSEQRFTGSKCTLWEMLRIEIVRIVSKYIWWWVITQWKDSIRLGQMLILGDRFILFYFLKGKYFKFVMVLLIFVC